MWAKAHFKKLIFVAPALRLGQLILIVSLALALKLK